MSFLNDVKLVREFAKPLEAISNSLPVNLTHANTSWFLKNEIPKQKLTVYDSLISGKEKNQMKVFKEGKGRKIFKANFEETPCIYKSFKFNSFSKKILRHKMYAWDEAAGLIIAKQRNLPVPNVLAFLMNKGGCLVNYNCVIMEEIKNSIHPVDIFKNKSKILSLDETLRRCKALMIKVYESSCNHIDLHGTSFLLDLSSPKNDKIIDFQFSVFHDRPSLNIFTHQVAHFVRASIKYADKKLLDDWAYDLLSEVAESKVENYLKLYDKEVVRSVPSSSERMRLQA